MTKTAVKFFKALSDETRVQILGYLYKNNKLPCQELLKKFKISQPTFSHHIGKLIDAGILTVTKEGTAHSYSINKGNLKRHGIDIQRIIAA